LKSLRPYQQRSVEDIKCRAKIGLFLEMGLGKTVTTLTAIQQLISELDIAKVLIVAPKRVADMVWTAEAKEWEHLQGLSFAKIQGNEKQRLEAMQTKAQIYLVSRDNAAWLCGQFGGSMLPYDMVVIDESSSFKNPSSVRFKALKNAIQNVPRVVLLTGTPSPNGLLDLWSQIYLLDRGQRLGKNITAYREAYFRKGYSGFGYELLNQYEELIRSKISDICVSMKASDYLDLPARVEHLVPIDLGSELKNYKRFEREQIMQTLDGTQVTALNAAALSNKLCQYANGTVYDGERSTHDLHSFKLDALDEIVEASQGAPILVAWAFKHDRDRIKQQHPHARTIENQKDLDDWNAGKIQMLLMHPASGGHGLNLQHGGNIIVWYGMTWSLELYMQLNARLDRSGQTKSVQVYHLISSGTIDEDVIKAIKNKNTNQNALMLALKNKKMSSEIGNETDRQFTCDTCQFKKSYSYVTLGDP
jgi:SNF2 family DNA or RNA helicase